MTVSLLFSGFDHLSVQQAQKRYPPSKSCYGIHWERGHTHSNLYACVVSVMCLWWDWYRAKILAWQSSSSLTAYKSVICNTLGNSTKHYYRYRQEVIVRLSKPWESCTDHTCWGFSPSRSAHTLINLGLLLISGKAHQLVVLSGLSYSYLMLNGICTYAILRILLQTKFLLFHNLSPFWKVCTLELLCHVCPRLSCSGRTSFVLASALTL